MKRLILLDSGPLGMASNPRAENTTLECQQWLKEILRRGERIAVPEIADYEVRRELIKANRLNGLRRLNNLKLELEYIPIQTETMLLAAKLWAEVRRKGQPTAGSQALDGDVILSAQARLLSKNSTEVIVATTNVGHISRLTKASDWQFIS